MKKPKSLAQASAFASAQATHLQNIGGKQIAGTVIFGRFISCLGLSPDFDLTKKLDSILGGGLIKWDLGLKLMAFAPFKHDGLLLQKKDVMNANTIDDLGNLVV